MRIAGWAAWALIALPLSLLAYAALAWGTVLSWTLPRWGIALLLAGIVLYRWMEADEREAKRLDRAAQ